MLRINMFSTADKVKGQGVGSAYVELVRMLKDHFPNDFKITINSCTCGYYSLPYN